MSSPFAKTLLWIVASTVGLIIGDYAFTLFVVLVKIKGDPSVPWAYVLYGSLQGLFLGMGLGVGQWLAIRRRFPSARPWVFLTAIGLLAGGCLGTLANYGSPALLQALTAAPAHSLLAPVGKVLSAHLFAVSVLIVATHGIAVGVVLGFVQWLALRGHLRRSGLWIAACVAVWGIADIGNFLALVYLENTQISVSTIAWFEAVVRWPLVGIALGIVTGLLLSVLQKKEITSAPSTPDNLV